MRVFLAVIVAPLVMLFCCAPTVGAMQYADLTVRYVNKQVITYGDALMRMQMTVIDAQRRGKPTPKTATERLEALRLALEQLTDDLLLAEKAKELGIQADRDRITLEVMADARRSNLPLDLRTQAEMRKQRELDTSVERIVGWYISLAPQPTPNDLRRIYDTRTADFARPAQARVLQLMLRPASGDERRALQTERTALLRTAQDAADAEVRAVVTQHLDRYLAANPDQQAIVLDDLLRALSPMAPRDGLGDVDRRICTQAQALLDRSAALLDRDGIRQRLETVRLSLTGLAGRGLIDAFRTQAKALSQGPGAAQGGDIGWIEPGSFAPTFDQVVFGDDTTAPLARDAVSPVRFHGDIGFVVLVPERRAAVQRSFDDVSGEIERALLWSRRDAIRAQAVGILRKQASIRDVVQLSSLR